MRSHNQNQRGSTNWPFVIVLLALLVFIYMWWSAQEHHDQQQKDIEAATKNVDALRAVANERGSKLSEIAKVVGFQEVVVGNSNLGVDQAVGVDVAKLKPHLDATGMVSMGDAQVNGALKELMTEAVLKFDRARRTGEPTAEAKDYKYATMSDALKSKLQELAGHEVPAAPAPVLDPDDSEDQARYDQEKQDYEQALAEWRQMFNDAASMEGFKEYAETITKYAITDPDTADQIVVSFMRPLADNTVEEFFNAVRGLPAAMRAEFKSNKEADIAEIQRLTGILLQKEDELNTSKTALTELQGQHTTDITAKDGQIEQLQQQVSDASLAKQTAENALAAAKDTAKKDVARLDSELDARKEALRILKQKRELVIRRDDPDGAIVATNNILRTATIDLGFNDKVYVGQRFNVSALNKVGDRVNKGQIMVTKVTGQKSARVRITQMAAPLTQGDTIHNPLYNSREPINVFFAGAITKWPPSMAKQRLAEINVTLQSAITGDTDYIVIPNTWVVAAQAAAEGDAEEEDEDEGDSGAKSPIEVMQGHARKVGAEVITESLFDYFLAY